MKLSVLIAALRLRHLLGPGDLLDHRRRRGRPDPDRLVEVDGEAPAVNPVRGTGQPPEG